MPDPAYNSLRYDSSPHDRALSAPNSAGDGFAQSLQHLSTKFAIELAFALRTPLSTNIEISPLPAESLPYRDFMASRTSPTCLAVLKIDPPGAQMCLELTPQIAYPMIDRLLGGFGDAARLMPTRSLTQIEQGLALQIIERAAAVLADTWSSVIALTVREEGLFSDPADVRIMPGDELVSVVPFHITFKDQAGRMSLCIPAPMTDLLCGSTLSGTPAIQPDATQPDAMQPTAERDTNANNLMHQAIELRALLAQTKLRLSEVLALHEGDIITTDVQVDSAIPLRTGDKLVRHGRLVQSNERRALELTDGRTDEPAGGQRPS